MSVGFARSSDRFTYLFAALPLLVLAGLCLVAAASPAEAQNYGMDARSIGLGAIGSTRNVASELVKEERPYRRIGLPLGLLFQVLPNREVFFPKVTDDKVRDEFDLFRAMEYASGPLHCTFGRDDSGTGQALVNDVLNDELNRDLNVYRGFRPATKLTAEGVGSPSWGKTFKIRRSNNPDSFHGVYIGAGPYASVTTETLTDPELADLLGSPVPVFAPSTIFGVSHETTSQASAAITFGYRVSRPTDAPAVDDRLQGVFFATNVNYLVGLHFDRVNTDIAFETNAAGLIATDEESTTTPLTLNYLSSNEGRGISIDTGVIYVAGRWDVGVGVNGIANRTKWTGVELRQSIDESLSESGDEDDDGFDPVPAPDVTVEIPINVSANVAYHADAWSATAEYARRFRGNNFQGGLEYPLGRLALRGGARYARDRWHPAAGVGIDLTPRFGVDVAVFGTSTNVERHRHATIAVSLRFNRVSMGSVTAP
jgi:hypothetical protein